MKKINVDHIINLILFMYIFSIYLFTFQENLNIISNILALMLIGMIWTNFFLLKKKLIFNNFLLFYLLFIIFCLCSAFFALNPSEVIEKTQTLISLFVLMTSLINYIYTLDKVHKLMKYFAYSGFITSIYIILKSDFSSVTRFGSELGNVNAIGMIISISSVFCYYFILEKKEYKFVPILLINTIVILMTGSRKSLIFLVFSFALLMLSNNDKQISHKLKKNLWSIVIIFIVLYAIYNIPIFYQIIGKRMDSLFDFVFGDGSSEGSINKRSNMIQFGIRWFKEKPFTGYGVNNYQFLLGQTTGEVTYSHNNIVELLVGVGMFGTLMYYSTHVIVLGNLLQSSNRFLSKTLTYSFLAIVLGYTFMSVGLVYYDSKHISILLAIGSVFGRLSNKELKKDELKNANCNSQVDTRN